MVPPEKLTKPQLVQLFEGVASVMELGVGHTCLELYFDNGHLRRWTTRYERNGHEALRRFDGRARQVL